MPPKSKKKLGTGKRPVPVVLKRITLNELGGGNMDWVEPTLTQEEKKILSSIILGPTNPS